MRVVKAVKPTIVIGKSHATINDEGITYNEAGVTYNEAGVSYGGLYDYDVSPLISQAKGNAPTMNVGRTRAAIYDQDITYNEAGLSYNEAGYAYGGFYEHDIYPLISGARAISPRIVLSGDLQGTQSAGNSGMLMGIMGLTYP